MQVKVTLKGISIPPYLSTTWNNILNLSSTGSELQVKLTDGSVIQVPNLAEHEKLKIFELHQKFLEAAANIETPKTFRLDIAQIDESGKLGFMAFDELGTMMQHNPAQSDLPDLPPQILEKIEILAQSLPTIGLQELPQAHPNCNCMHCQITRALTGETKDNLSVEAEENIPDNELTFSEWIVKETGDKLFTVTHKLDAAEEYQVFLGNPIGCTCGNNKCEHILAVLKS
jgi:hypothetical protein